LNKQKVHVSERVKLIIISFYAVFILLSSFLFNTPYEILKGVVVIVQDQSILISDYMEIANPGTALFNSGLLMLFIIIIAKLNKVNINGTMIAAVFTVGGFALFGKNIFNIWSIFLGVFLFAVYSKDKFSKYFLVASFGTGLAPLTSLISFGLGFPQPYGILIGFSSGVVAGFFLPALANHFIKFHQGFNIYNVGFTIGVVGTVAMSVIRAFDLNSLDRAITASGWNFQFSILLSVIFCSMLLSGFILNGNSIKGYGGLIKRSGRLVSDFVVLDGFGLSLFNMGLTGFISLTYVLTVRGELNGPVIGGIFTVVGFSAFGKHVRNILPIFIGVLIASSVKMWEVNDTGSLLAALFGTTLAPVAGAFGWRAGIITGCVHMAVVMNVGIVHGGVNLYNNGFAGGIVAAVMVPIIEIFRKEA
jgi:hypothetical protein